MHRTLTCILTTAVLTACNGTNPPVAGGGASDSPIRGAPAHDEPAQVPKIGGCQIFPANNPWNTDISGYPVDKSSDAYIAALPGVLQPDFGDNPQNGIPINVVPRTQTKVPISFYYSYESDPGPYPIPRHPEIQGGWHAIGDRHLLILQRGSCKLYEMWKAYPEDHGTRWQAGSGAVFRLNSNKLRPNGWTSADAAGLAMFPAIIKCAEVRAGEIDHAMRVTFAATQQGYIHPATHYSSYSRLPTLPPMGLRLRMKASYDISFLYGQAHVIAVAMKKYGLFVADNGPNWNFQGEGGHQAKCWNNYDLHQLWAVPNTAFEVVKTGRIIRKP